MSDTLLKKPHALRFIPEVSLGHIIQIFLVLIPLVVYITRLEAKAETTANKVTQLEQTSDRLETTVALLAQNQAVLIALFDAHQKLNPTIKPVTPTVAIPPTK